MIAGRQWYIRSALISSLPDDVINETVIQFANTPLGCSMFLVFVSLQLPLSNRDVSLVIRTCRWSHYGLRR